MKNKNPFFTYIITILNASIPATVWAILGTALIIRTNTEGQSVSFNELFTPSVIFGYTFCIVVSLIYFYLVRRQKIAPKWWTNSLLILLSYLSMPIHAFAYAKTIGIHVDHHNENFNFSSLTMEAWLLTGIGFTWVTIRTKKPAKTKTPKQKQAKLRYLKWLLFPLLYYTAFLITGIIMVALLEINFFITSTLARFANLLLLLPLYNDATKVFISTHFSGPKGHIILLANAVIWGVAIGSISKFINTFPIMRRKSSIEQE